jgi:hypothetical protein
LAGAPLIEGGLAKATGPARLLDGHARVSLFEKTNDLLIGTSGLFHSRYSPKLADFVPSLWYGREGAGQSLCYAKRKTSELDIESVEYAQGDLLKPSSFDRTFDAIESSGVLHHLENPFERWEVLLGLLRPSGLMKLGFYSELAIQDIVRVRHLIRNSGIGSSSQEIRNFRKKLLDKKESEDYRFAISSADFFSTSACRDLLFHVQEHRMDLKKLSDFLKDHNLNFLSFEIDSSVIRSYKNRFPNDTAATNLDHWKIYEEENPRTFDAMYQFWIQKSLFFTDLDSTNIS